MPQNLSIHIWAYTIQAFLIRKTGTIKKLTLSCPQAQLPHLKQSIFNAGQEISANYSNL